VTWDYDLSRQVIHFKLFLVMGITAGTLLIILGTTLIALGKAMNDAAEKK
jgi:hypothetical protein